MRSFSSIFAITFAASLLFANATAQETITAAADKANYAYGDNVSISGKVPAYVEGAKGSIKVLTSKNKVFLDTSFTPKPDGTFAYTFRLEGSLLEEGTWTARISYQGKNVIASFKVLAQELLLVDVKITIGSSNPNNAKFYDPKEITVKKGTKVVWNNNDVTAHTVTYGEKKGSPGVGSLFDSGMIRSGTFYEHTFADVGDYPYFCTVYPWMTGRIIVVEEVQVPVTVELSMTTDKAKYKLGETVKVAGSAKPVQDKDVVVQVFNPGNSTFSLGQFRLLADGKFAYSFPLKGDLAVPGNYTIKATYLNETISRIIQVQEAPIPTPQPDTQPKSGSKINAERVSFVDVSGSEKKSLGIGEQVLVQSKLTNTQGVLQEFVFIVQVKDSDGIIVMLSWFQSALNPKQTVSVAQSWTPDSEGRFTVQAFVWRSVLDPVPLTTESLQTTIKVA